MKWINSQKTITLKIESRNTADWEGLGSHIPMEIQIPRKLLK